MKTLRIVDDSIDWISVQQVMPGMAIIAKPMPDYRFPHPDIATMHYVKYSGTFWYLCITDSSGELGTKEAIVKVSFYDRFEDFKSLFLECRRAFIFFAVQP